MSPLSRHPLGPNILDRDSDFNQILYVVPITEAVITA